MDQRSSEVSPPVAGEFALPLRATFGLGDRVRKKSGAAWQGQVVGWYSTKLTPEGYAVEFSRVWPMLTTCPCCDKPIETLRKAFLIAENLTLIAASDDARAVQGLRPVGETVERIVERARR